MLHLFDNDPETQCVLWADFNLRHFPELFKLPARDMEEGSRLRRQKVSKEEVEKFLDSAQREDLEHRVQEQYRKLKLPERRGGFDGIIVVPRGISVSVLLQELAKIDDYELSPGDLDRRWSHDRRPTKTYAIRVRDSIDGVTGKLKQKTPRDLDMAGFTGITIIEYLLLNLRYRVERGGLLETRGVNTLCLGTYFGKEYLRSRLEIQESPGGIVTGRRMLKLVPVPENTSIQISWIDNKKVEREVFTSIREVAA